MTLEQFAYLAEIIGVILVVASLIYVAQQLRQNTAMMKAGSRQAMMGFGQEILFKVIDYPDIFFGMAKGQGELSDEEKIRMDQWLRAVLRGREYDWLQYREGLVDEASFTAYSQIIPAVLGTRRSQEWWKTVGQDTLDPEFVAYVDELMSDRPHHDTWQRILQIS